ncbi:MAG: stage II sporulation protein M [Thaumarchaeota archaeon]|nr:stage II sporulation protein M [Nitrososphaerota archaeon]
MGIFSTAYSIGSASNMSEQDSKSFIKEFEQAVEGIDAIGIFTHNASVALPMFIPGFGMAWGSFAAWSTGLAFKALVSTTPALAKLPPLAIIYLSPFGVMELIAYSIGMSRSFLLISIILKRKTSLKEEIRPTAIEIGIVIGLLLAAAFIEYAMIQEFGSSLVHPKSH